MTGQMGKRSLSVSLLAWGGGAGDKYAHLLKTQYSNSVLLTLFSQVTVS